MQTKKESHAEFLTRQAEQNPRFARAVLGSVTRPIRDGRNRQCECGSGKRAKVCCLHKRAKMLRRMANDERKATPCN